MIEEVWKDVVGYEGFYLVSNLGNIRKAGKVANMKPFSSTGGYMQQPLRMFGKSKALRVHRVVAFAFIPNPENKPEVNHINGVKTDNRAENLEWMTSSENSIHAIKLGLCNYTRVMGGNGANSKLKEKEVIEIRKIRSETGLPYKKIADKFGVTWRTIHKIVKYETWRHVS